MVAAGHRHSRRWSMHYKGEPQRRPEARLPQIEMPRSTSAAGPTVARPLRPARRAQSEAGAPDATAALRD
ncbi:MAG: hypothetical protein MZV49_10560 [Rhodopseudomonas palustris]|nr:hypothetical protein [Rhodopseudomonas palustris]